MCFQLKLSLAQKGTEIEELEENMSELLREKQASQQRAALLQTCIDQLTEVRSHPFICTQHTEI